MTVLLDNKNQGKVGDALKENIQPDARLSIASGLFSIYGYAALKKELTRVGAIRLLLPLDNPNEESPFHLEGDFHLQGLTGDAADRRFRNTLNIAQIARECADWLEKKAEIKTVSLPVSQNLIHVANPDGSAVAIHGSSQFTSTGLGIVPSAGYEMNTLFSTPIETSTLLNWFDSIWNNPKATQDVKAFVLAQVKELLECCEFGA